MENFEFLRHITIGQYLPRGSVIHRLDPRTKITALMLLALVISLNATLMGNLILFSSCLALIVTAQLPWRYIFGGLKPALPLIIIFAILQLIFYSGTYIPPTFAPATLFRWGPIHITTASVQ